MCVCLNRKVLAAVHASAYTADFFFYVGHVQHKTHKIKLTQCPTMNYKFFLL